MTATIDRTAMVRGPGTIQLGAAGPVFYDKDGITADLELTQFQILTSMRGNVDNRPDDVLGKIAFTPAGEVAVADLAALYPYQSPDIGSSILGATDTPAIIHSKAGKIVTFHNTAITGMPDLILSANKTLFAAAELTAAFANNTARSAAAAMYTIATEAFSDASFATANVKTAPYAGVFSDIFASIITEAGWTISFEVGVQPHTIDDIGTVDLTLESVGVMAKCVPANLAESEILDALNVQGSVLANRGVSLRQSNDLVLTGPSGALTVTIHDAALVVGPQRWGSTDLRTGEIGFIGHRAEAEGVFTNLFTVAITA